MFVESPWTQEQVAALNAHQRNPAYHPFTCGSGNRTDKKHLDGEGVLVAMIDGWMCPWCDYRQNWAHGSMTENQVDFSKLDRKEASE